MSGINIKHATIPCVKLTLNSSCFTNNLRELIQKKKDKKSSDFTLKIIPVFIWCTTFSKKNILVLKTLVSFLS